MKRAFEVVYNIVGKVSNVFLLISALAVVFIAAINTVDSIGRYIVGRAIVGASELVAVSMTIFVFGGLAMAIRLNRCVAVPVIGEKLKPRVRYFVLAVGNLLCVFAGVMMTIQFWQSSLRYLGNHTLGTDILRIPLYPFYVYATIAMAVITLEFLFVAVKQLDSGIHNKAADAGPADAEGKEG